MKLNQTHWLKLNQTHVRDRIPPFITTPSAKRFKAYRTECEKSFRYSNKCETGSQQLQQQGQTIIRSSFVTNSNSEGLQRKILSKMESGIWSAKHTRRLDPNWRSYVSKPILRRGDDGLSYRVDRTKALGNSIVPQVAAIPLKRVHDLYYNE